MALITRDLVIGRDGTLYQCGQVIDVNKETEETIVQLIEEPNCYIVAKGVTHHKKISNVGSIGYFVELNKNPNDNNWYIVSQAKDLEDIAESNKVAHRYNDAKKRMDALSDNFIEICFGKESNIDTFSRSRDRWKNGYAKVIKDIDSCQKNGYGLKGEFISLTNNTKTRLYENELYLDCTRSKTNYKDDIYHLFTVKDKKIVLLAKENSIRELWDDIESFIATKKPTSLYTLFSSVTDFTEDKTVLREFAEFLLEYTEPYSKINNANDFITAKMMREIHHLPITEMTDVTETNTGTYYD